MEKVTIILFTYLSGTTHLLLSLPKLSNHNFLLDTLKWKSFHHLTMCTILQNFPSCLKEKTQIVLKLCGQER